MITTSLSVTDLVVYYGAAIVLENVSLEICSGEVVGLVGANGAGKTTTLRAISGSIPRRAGSIIANGEELPLGTVRTVARGIVHVPEGRGLLPSLTVEQNLRFGAYAARKRYGHEEVALVERVFPTLSRLTRRRAGSLSGGEQQMVAIARGLVSGPRLLLVDELSLGLAPKLVSDLLRTLIDVARERSIGLLLVDQNVRALSRVCDRVFVLSNGCSKLVTGDGADYGSVYFGGEESPV